MKLIYIVNVVIITGLLSSRSCAVEDAILSDENQLQVSGKYEDVQNEEQTAETPPPPGHMKQLGEHGRALTGQIMELDYMIGGKDFYEFFVRKRQPIVFRGVTKDWEATKYWKNESYLLEHYSDVIFDVEMKKVYKGDLHPRKTMDFREFLSSYKNTSLYLDSPFPQSLLMNDLKLPLMMQCEVLREAFKSMHLLFSNGGTSCPLHADGYENFLSLFSGQKIVYIIEPVYGDHLYMDQVKDFPGVSPINPEAVDLVSFPLFQEVPFHKVVLEEGDMLYIPQGWYHQVRSYQSPNIAASMWFQYFTKILEVEFAFRSQLEQEAQFAKIVNESSETIECKNQNIEIRHFEKLNLDAYVHMKTGDAAKLGKSFINNTELTEAVDLAVPTIYVGSDDRWIYAIDLHTGKIKWRVETRNDTGSTCAFNLAGNVIYCGADDGYFRAIDAKTGVVVWALKTGGSIVSSPYVDDMGVIYFGSFDQNIYAVHPDGAIKWRNVLFGVIWASPVIHPEHNLIFIATQRGDYPKTNIYALDKATGKIIWKKYSSGGFIATPRLSLDFSKVYLCDASTYVSVFNSLDGKKLHKMRLDQNDSISATPAVDKNDVLYILLLSGRLLSLDTHTYKIGWQLELGESEMGSSSSPHLSFDGILYVGGGNGTVYALHSNTGEIKWKSNIGNSIFFSSPRITKDGLLLIGSVDGPLYALDSETGAKVWSAHTNGPLVGTALITKGFI